MYEQYQLLEFKKLFLLLREDNLFDQFLEYSGQFSDELFSFAYCLKNKSNPLYQALGVSIFSPQSAIIRALQQLAENSSIFTSKIDIKYEQGYYKDFGSTLIPIDTSSVDTKLHKFLHAKRLGIHKDLFVPSEIIFLSKEQQLTPSAVASGFNYEKAKKQAISELICNDATMLWNFDVFRGIRIDLRFIGNKVLSKIINELKWYKFDLITIEIINDIGIPIYVSFIVDTATSYPYITHGTGLGINGIFGIIDSIEKALQKRYSMKLDQFEKLLIYTPQESMTNENNSLLTNNNYLKKFLKKINKLPIKNDITHGNFEINQIIDLFAKKNVNFYSIDIGKSLFKSIDYSIIKILSPDLQQYDFDKNRKKINLKRIHKINQNITLSNINKLLKYHFYE